MSSPSNMMVPAVLSISRITIIEVVDLPQPDSPTSPTLSPRPTVKLMPSTARKFSGSTAGLGPNSFVSVPRASLRGYSLTSFSTTSRGLAACRCRYGRSAWRFLPLPQAEDHAASRRGVASPASACVCNGATAL